MEEIEKALRADNGLALRLIAKKRNLTWSELLNEMFTATALIYAEATEPKRSEIFKALLTLMEFLQDERLAIATNERFETLN